MKYKNGLLATGFIILSGISSVFLTACSSKQQNTTQDELAKTATRLLALNNQAGFNKLIMTKQEWISFADQIVRSSKKSDNSNSREIKEFTLMRVALRKSDSRIGKRLAGNIARIRESFSKVRLSAIKAGIDWKNYKIVDIRKDTKQKYAIKNSDITVKLQSPGGIYKYQIDDAYNWSGEWRIGDAMRD